MYGKLVLHRALNNFYLDYSIYTISFALSVFDLALSNYTEINIIFMYTNKKTCIQLT